ncbi:STING domain-containing protein [Allomuricauda sp. M10]|uniref:STING domain-containing protein n=1 Tax=Allomuricauda sp. M10 TaxID=2683292 RepID=UPI001D1820A0|nr:STING domain-containing protein [Muricauda sp. M10]
MRKNRLYLHNNQSIIPVLSMLITNRSLYRIQSLFQWLSVIILVASVLFAALWLYNSSMNLEPLLAFLGLFYSIVAIFGGWLNKRLGDKLADEELSIAYALAYGYIYNYLAPVVRRLRKEQTNPDAIEFLVYIPKHINELKSSSIDEVITELSNKQYVVETVELLFSGEKRKMDYRTAKKKNSKNTQYFDFPTTILTLEKAIEYKLSTNKNSYPDKEIAELSEQYISNFGAQMKKILEKPEFDAIRNNIKIVGSGRFHFLENTDPANINNNQS